MPSKCTYISRRQTEPCRALRCLHVSRGQKIPRTHPERPPEYFPFGRWADPLRRHRISLRMRLRQAPLGAGGLNLDLRNGNGNKIEVGRAWKEERLKSRALRADLMGAG